LARVSADCVPDKIVRYCVWHFYHKKKYSATVKSVLFHKDHNTVYNSQILRHLLGVWLQYSLHLADFLQKWAIIQNKTILADCPLKNFVRTGVFPTSVFHIRSPTAIPNSSHKQIHRDEQYTCLYYKATFSNYYFELITRNICLHKVHKDQHSSHQTRRDNIPSICTRWSTLSVIALKATLSYYNIVTSTTQVSL
jgi:hypothetical protein